LSKFKSADGLAALVEDGDTVAVTGAGGGLVEPDAILEAIERRYLATGAPRDLTVVHAQGLGDGERRGLNRLAHRGLVARVIGAHWAWSPRMQALAAEEAIEAYALPGGAIQHLIRETGAGRPGLITSVGLGTMADPRHGGGRMNDRAREALTEIIEIDGREYLRYRPLPIDVAVLRASRADADGNLSLDDEGAELDALVLAMAAHNCGGRVLAQVREEAARGSLPARSVRVPGALVDWVCLAPDQPQSYRGAFEPGLSGRLAAADLEPEPHSSAPAASLERRIVAARAAEVLEEGGVVSFGLGFPDEVANIARTGRPGARLYQTLDHGHYGGEPLKGSLFGFVRGGAALIDSPSQFDFYSGRGIDTAFLGFGQIDAHGDVNVSRLGGRIIGPGGFIDISQGAKTVVFCGGFETGGLEIGLDDGRLRIVQPGATAKLVGAVEQITFSGLRARQTGQRVIYVTERAVLTLEAEGVVLREVAPGADLRRDVLDRMGFSPILPPGGPRPMTGLFAGQP
jgi:propionate CoA-transferase